MNEIDILGGTLSQAQFQGVTFKCKLASSDVFHIALDIVCSSEKEAAGVVEILNQAKPRFARENRDVKFDADGGKIIANIQINGIEKIIKDKMKEK